MGRTTAPTEAEQAEVYASCSRALAPGQPPRPSTRTAVPGLFLAGDWIATGLPATIESAVVSGHLAADAVLPTCAR